MAATLTTKEKQTLANLWSEPQIGFQFADVAKYQPPVDRLRNGGT
jgi:hypothetical protein